MKRYAIKNKQIIDKKLNNTKCDIRLMHESFAEWVCEVLNVWYEQKGEDMQLSEELLRTMHIAYKADIAPEDWV